MKGNNHTPRGVLDREGLPVALEQNKKINIKPRVPSTKTSTKQTASPSGPMSVPIKKVKASELALSLHSNMVIAASAGSDQTHNYSNILDRATRGMRLYPPF
jgi:hypothetical protein